MVTIEKLVYGGDGLARADGKVVFVPFSLPGEQWEDGRLLTPSPDRIEPKCEYFSRCGGCHYQHFPYEKQLERKPSILVETLSRIGKIAPPEIDLVRGPEWQYRNRAQLHFDAKRFGFHAAGSNRLVEISHCDIVSPAIASAIQALKEMSRERRFPGFLKSVELFSNESETLVNVLDTGAPLSRKFFEWCAERIPGATLSALNYTAGGRSFRVSHKAFFQVNRFLVDELTQLAVGDATGKLAFDLYAGVGLFSLPLTKNFERVSAVEVVGSAAHDLEFNANQAGVRLDAIRAKTEDFLAAATDTPDFVLADPPRAGLGKQMVERLLRLAPSTLRIVSCDPATLARDLSALTVGGYGIEKMTLIDLFPQTFHIETVTTLIRG